MRIMRTVRTVRTVRIVTAACVGIGLSTLAIAAPKWAKKGDTIVKCKGVARKGKNDCGANNHACSGKATKDRDPNEWIYVPKGVCEKIAGGVVLVEKGKKK